jgi:hypothetical protein
MRRESTKEAEICRCFLFFNQKCSQRWLTEPGEQKPGNWFGK